MLFAVCDQSAERNMHITLHVHTPCFPGRKKSPALTMMNASFILEVQILLFIVVNSLSYN